MRPDIAAAPAAIPRPGRSGARKYLTLAMLMLVYTLSYVDRQAIGILSIPIKTDLQLSDTQLGLLGGFAFAIFYTSLAVPIARLADRMSRVTIIAVALTVWSIFTSLCGAAGGFASLFLARVGVGVGEAGGLAPSYSLLSDYFAPHERGRAFGLFSLGVPLGSAVGVVGAGYMATDLGWRLAFVILGAVGIVCVVPFLLLVREVPVGELDEAPVSVEAHRFTDVLRFVFTRPVFCVAALATGFGAIMSYGLAFWLPSYIRRSLDLDLRQTAILLGISTLLGGSISMLASGSLADWLEARGRRGYALVPMWGCVASLALLLLAMAATSFVTALIALTILFVFSQAYAPPTLALVQNHAPASMRTTISAVFMLVVNLMGAGLGPALLGKISDLCTARFGPNGLGYAIAAGGTLFYGLAAAFFAWELRLMRSTLQTTVCSLTETSDN